MRLCFVDYICDTCKQTFEAEFENTTPDLCPATLDCQCGGTLQKRPGIPAPVGPMFSNEETRANIIGVRPGEPGYDKATKSNRGFDQVMESKGLRTTDMHEASIAEDRINTQLAEINRAKRESALNDGDPTGLQALQAKKRQEEFNERLNPATRAAAGGRDIGQMVEQAKQAAAADPRALDYARRQQEMLAHEDAAQRVGAAWAAEHGPNLGAVAQKSNQIASNGLADWLGPVTPIEMP